jgi:hypothetical protein
LAPANARLGSQESPLLHQVWFPQGAIRSADPVRRGYEYLSQGIENFLNHYLFRRRKRAMDGRDAPVERPGHIPSQSLYFSLLQG